MNDVMSKFEEMIREHEGRKPFFDTASFPWAEEVEAMWPDIRREADCVLGALDYLPGFEELQFEQRDLSQDKRWKVFPLHVYGRIPRDSERRCPQTVRALRKIPGMLGAMFSVLQPGKELPPHRGAYAGVLRYHLGVKVPHPDQCGICVDGEEAQWLEGKSLVFDDSYMHHAWNRSGEDRVVLFVDFLRPLAPKLNAMNQSLVSLLGKSQFMDQAAVHWTEWNAKYGHQLDAEIEKKRLQLS